MILRQNHSPKSPSLSMSVATTDTKLILRFVSFILPIQLNIIVKCHLFYIVQHEDHSMNRRYYIFLLVLILLCVLFFSLGKSNWMGREYSCGAWWDPILTISV